MRHLLVKALFFVAALTGTACSEYQKMLNSEDYPGKFELANQLFADGKYGKALPLYDELKRIYLGQEQMKLIIYNLAQCEFETEQYYLAAYHYKQFYDSYPFAKQAEDALFLHCKCLYTTSPKESLDQSSAQKTISALESFALAFPDSDKILEANKLIDELRRKQEEKAFKTASLYHKIENYKAAVWALGNFNRDYPGSIYEEQAMFLVLESAYLYARVSVRKKQEERYIEFIEYYKGFKNAFPSSKLLKKAKEYLDNAQNELKKLQ
ncbi:MAG: outer membrane protein assembly factor BamD [Bacteroidetes bacterium]|nr:outer membrane protein assembly factor BamD [Bacteroidota bacterium]